MPTNHHIHSLKEEGIWAPVTRLLGVIIFHVGKLVHEDYIFGLTTGAKGRGFLYISYSATADSTMIGVGFPDVQLAAACSSEAIPGQQLWDFHLCSL